MKMTKEMYEEMIIDELAAKREREEGSTNSNQRK
jgi:hypothetical protein